MIYEWISEKNTYITGENVNPKQKLITVHIFKLNSLQNFWRIDCDKNLIIIVVIFFVLGIDGGLPHLFFHCVMNQHTHEH